jgi:hypothetical protein
MPEVDHHLLRPDVMETSLARFSNDQYASQGIF